MRSSSFISFRPVALATFVLLAPVAACQKGAVPSSASAAAASSSADGKPTIVQLGGRGCADRLDCERRCFGGEAEQCRALGDALQFDVDGGKDDAKATSFYLRGCELGSAAACLSAGHMVEYHRGVEKNDARAADLYKKGCDLGYVPSCANRAIMLENGRGVVKDVAKALTLYAQACSAGAGLGCERQRALVTDAGPSP